MQRILTTEEEKAGAWQNRTGTIFDQRLIKAFVYKEDKLNRKKKIFTNVAKTTIKGYDCH